MSAFYAAIDVCVIPSRSESFPYAMLESAACALPIVASNVGGIPELIENEVTGLLFKSGDVEELSSSLVRLALDSEKRIALGAAAKSRLIEKFSIEQTAEAHRKIYRTVLEREKSRADDGKTTDFLISGYYGYGNLGDEAVLDAIVDGIRTVLPSASFEVLSRHPKKSRLECGINASFRYGVPMKKAIRRSRVLISGGGTLMQDKTSRRSLAYYLSVIKRAKKSGLRVMQYANGFGPIQSPKSLENTVKIINSTVDAVTARDGDALVAMQRAGITVPITPSADPTLEKEQARCHSDAYAAVSLRPLESDRLNFVISRAVRRICDDLGLRPVFVVMQKSTDERISRRCAELTGGEVLTPESVGEASEIFARAALTVAVRLHAAILSVRSGVPTVAVAYDEKVTGFMHSAGLDSVIDARCLTEDGLLCAAALALSAPKNGRTEELSRLAGVSPNEAKRLLELFKNQCK